MPLRAIGLRLSVIFALVISLAGCSAFNGYQAEGEISFKALDAPVTVLRDEKGMAYIYADSRLDALRAYGFIAAQDRLFQMELTRLFSQGRIAELAGEKAVGLDTRMKTFGFYRYAAQHADLLDTPTRQFFQAYVDGVNAYIANMRTEHHLEFKLAGIQPGTWKISDCLSIFYYMSWGSSANIKTEALMQMLADKLGATRARQLLPVNLNPDAPPDSRIPGGESLSMTELEGKSIDWSGVLSLQDGPPSLGSNSWAVGGQRSRSGKPVVVNDPHLDARILPGPWYPAGLIFPGYRIVGVGVPGIPGLVIFRSNYVAVGITNSYADSQDLYVETVDPGNANNYLEGERSIPFTILTEKLKIKDKKAPSGYRSKEIRIRLSRRGPIVSDVLKNFKTDKVLSLRWAPAETMGPAVGLDRLMTATSTDSIRAKLKDLNTILLNFVFADVNGNIGWISSGRVPIRLPGTGTVPHIVADATDTWTGWIPYEKMPQARNPQKGWVGTCNHKTIQPDYPYYLSSYYASSYRYRRLKELMETESKKSADDHWEFMRDTKNTMAAKLAPVMAAILKSDAQTAPLGSLLASWDFKDDPEKAAPLIFQAVYRNFALHVFEDELGPALAADMLGVWYFWQERLQRMVLEGNSVWFDDTRTTGIQETLAEVMIQAARQARVDLSNAYGPNPEKWTWGAAHTIELVSPIRRQGFGKAWVGSGTLSFPGSGETLHRGLYAFKQPFEVTISAALRMAADFSDPDKIMAVLPGGVSGRLFDPHNKDQVKAFISGEKRYWWFSEKAIQDHTRHKLILKP
jgi:penicillin amidase